MLNPLLLRGVFRIIENIAFFLIFWNSLYIGSLLSQQKPKKEKAAERHLLKRMLLFAFLNSLVVIIIIITTVRLRLWGNAISAIFVVSFSLFLLAIYPLILSLVRKKYIEVDKIKQRIVSKVIIAFFVSLTICIITEIFKNPLIKNGG
jgi:hypothetical protein